MKLKPNGVSLKPGIKKHNEAKKDVKMSLVDLRKGEQNELQPAKLVRRTSLVYKT